MPYSLVIAILISISTLTSVRAESLLVAELLTTDKRSCESGNFDIVVKFHGQGPWNAELEYTRQDGGLIERSWVSVNNLFDLEDGIFTLSSTTLNRMVHGSMVRVRLVAARNLEHGLVMYPVGVQGEASLYLDAMPNPNAGPDQTLCGFTATLAAMPSPLSNIHTWSGPEGITFSNPTDPRSVANSIAPGQYTLQFIQTNGACTAQDEVTLNLRGSPSGTISTDSEICREGIAEIDINLTGNGPWNLVYSDGTNLFPLTNRVENSISVEKNIRGETAFTLVSLTDAFGCAAPPHLITGRALVEDLEPNANAGINSHACGLAGSLNATPPAEGIGRWSSLNNLVTFASPAQFNSSVTVPTHGSHTFTWEVNNRGCIASSQVTVNFTRHPEVAAMLPVNRICEGETTPLNITITSDHGPWVVSIEGNAITREIASSDNSFQHQLSPANATTYRVVSVSDRFGCITSPAGMNFTLAVDRRPTPNAGADRESCGNSINLSASPPLNIGRWSSWHPGIFEQPDSPVTNFSLNTLTGSETVSLRWTETNGVCTVHDDVNITFYQPITSEVVNAGSDIHLYHQFSTYLNASTVPFGIGRWTVVSGSATVENINDPNSQLTGITFGTTTLQWSVSNGTCPRFTDELTINMEGLKHPTGFSPNNDGKNDTFRILGSTHVPNNELVVFSQAGMVIYSTTGFEEWNGRDQNNNLVPDGYYYFIFSGDGITPIKDYLVIKRE